MCNRRAFYKADHYRRHGGHPRKRAWKENFRKAFSKPPANVRELDDKFELYLFAPGFEKKDFLIALIDDTLSISVENKKEEQENWKRQEYQPKAFVRQFELNEKIDKSAIVAKYENGVLILSLPKLEGFETDRQEITIA